MGYCSSSQQLSQDRVDIQILLSRDFLKVEMLKEFSQESVRARAVVEQQGVVTDTVIFVREKLLVVVEWYSPLDKEDEWDSSRLDDLNLQSTNRDAY